MRRRTDVFLFVFFVCFFLFVFFTNVGKFRTAVLAEDERTTPRAGTEIDLTSILESGRSNAHPTRHEISQQNVYDYLARAGRPVLLALLRKLCCFVITDSIGSSP